MRHGGNTASYTPSGDSIRVPQFGLSADAQSYYSEFAHEHTHWTGAKARLDRDFSGRFGSHAHTFEELLAE